LGGTATYWQNMGVADRPDYQLTTLNIVEPKDEHPTIRQLRGDATDTDFSDNEFDVVFSNSVIEHVGGLDRQRAMASEIRRLAPSYYVQTPCRSFPIEPHHRSPLCHPYLPYAVRVREMQRIRKTHRFEAEWIINSVHSMNSRDFAQAFPDANIIRERVFGLTKSWIATRIRQPR
jgi:ubiquinone/menaquinone biosynthesis C-methylase UbiE